MTPCSICDYDSGVLCMTGDKCQECHALAWLLELRGLIPGLGAKEPRDTLLDLRVGNGAWTTVDYTQHTPRQVADYFQRQLYLPVEAD